MSNLKLIYFEGCPNAKPAIERLKQGGFEFDKIRQDDLPDNHELRNYSSPTLLKGDQIIFGSRASGGGCSLELPTIDQLKDLCSGTS